MTPQDEDNEVTLTWDDWGFPEDEDNEATLTWDDWDLLKDLDQHVLDALCPAPASPAYILDSVLQANEEADALLAKALPNNNADDDLIVEDIELVLQEIERTTLVIQEAEENDSLSVDGTLGTNDAFDDNSVAYEDEKKTKVTAIIKEFLEQTSLEEDLENEGNSKNNAADHADNSVMQQMEEQINKPADEPIARGAEQVLTNARVHNAERASMVVRGHNQLIMSVIDQRMNTNASSKALGIVGAGDETDNQHGIWVSPFIGNSVQKFSAGISDYKSKNSGVTLGYDSFVSDNLLLGYSYTGAITKIKYKNEKLGDESKVRSNIYSIYGLYNVPNKNWFISGIGLYGDSIVKNYVQRAVVIGNKISGYQIAYSKHKSYVYIGQLMVGYNYTLSSSASFKPMIGIRYDQMRDASYQESGTDYQNLTVKGISASLIEGMVGVRGTKDINTGHMVITPEIYGFVRRNFRDKASAIDARLFGMDNPLPSMALTRAKISINFGGGITAKYKSYEYGINYNSNIANKYLAHQASVKLRINF
ncbi:MAG: autotransporter outer membrane beta-barrel domain-containing protein [Rickettsia endosymbiont of Oxypoda opaca]|nr:autotransporter outer membrane beta-barrel domain-containing protein [Rickettsia endosymbiont of Oxypoda opaca]